jgi:hypothetical protein
MNHRSDDVAELEADVCVRMILAALRHDVLVQPARLGGVRGQGHEQVAPVDVQPVGHGTDSVRRIQLPVPVD